MSPRWRDEVAIYLAPHRLALVRRARGLQPRVMAATELAVAGKGADVGAVCARLAEVLADRIWHGAAARVVVADHPWARYVIVPWPATRLDSAGRLAQTRYLLADSYGEDMADWSVTLADTPPGRTSIACAVPAALRGALEETLAPARLGLVSLQPRLIASFNAWRQRLVRDDAWFVSVDEESLSAAHLNRGAWDRVHVARLAPGWSVELDRLHAFGRLTGAAGAPTRMFVEAPAWMRRDVQSSAGVEWLEDGGDGERAHHLALLRRTCP